jgi:hypothetical protein
VSVPKLRPELETALGLHRWGGPFTAEWCVSELFQIVTWDSKFSREVIYWSIVSALKRFDYECARRYVRDWASKGERLEPPVWDVSKFVPGDHFHVNGTKFNTLKEATSYIASKGAKFGRVWEKHVYTRPGD